MRSLHALILFFQLFGMQFSAAQESDLSKLVVQKKYTELQKRLEQKNVDRETKTIYQSILLNVFGKPLQSNKMIEDALNSKSFLSDSTKYMLLEAQHDNFVKLFNYSKAYETRQFLMNNYASFYTKEKIDDKAQTLNLLKALKDEDPQTVSLRENVVLPVTRNLIGLQTIPVSMNGLSYSFIFDTGAGISTVTDSIAEVLKLRILDKVPVVVKGGITGLGTNIRLGMAEKLSIGNIEVRNAVFLVFPDSTLTLNLKEGKFKIDPIIGFPVIKELGSVTFYPDKLEINKQNYRKGYQSNMAVDFLKPILFLNYNGEDLPFTFDTGAGYSVLTEVFYKRYRIVVDKEGTPKTESHGGAGGIRSFQVFVLPSIEFTNMDGTQIALTNISVSTEKIATGDNVYYGNLGQDLIKPFKSMTINFRQSWIKFND